jgi:hypothetical protein
MRVFLSWSGPTSRAVAAALHDWIPLVIQGAKPFISTGDIEKGKRWSDVIGDELNKAAYGILCITKDNRTAPWLHFEGGAISKAIDKSFVSPLLFNVEPSDIHGPFQQFQLTVCTEEDIWSLMRSINSRMDADEQVADSVLKREFDVWWLELKSKLDEIAQMQVDATHTEYSWLYTIEDLTHVHRSKTQTGIWWITPNPFEYALKPALKESIRDCIQRGVSYVFMVPALERSEDATLQLKHLAPGKPEAIQIVEIPNDEFRLAAVTDYVVNDPYSDSMEVFLELPLTDRGYWIKVDNAESAGGFVARFQALAEKYQVVLGGPRPPASTAAAAVGGPAEVPRP